MTQKNIDVMDIIVSKMAEGTTNALLRGKINTLSEAISFCNGNKITDIATLGRLSGIELFETILNYCWNRMTDNEKVYFLIDTVKRNESYIKAVIEL